MHEHICIYENTYCFHPSVDLENQLTLKILLWIFFLLGNINAIVHLWYFSNYGNNNNENYYLKCSFQSYLPEHYLHVYNDYKYM